MRINPDYRIVRYSPVTVDVIGGIPRRYTDYKLKFLLHIEVLFSSRLPSFPHDSL